MLVYERKKEGKNIVRAKGWGDRCDADISWAMNHIPTLLALFLVACFTWWSRGRFIDYRNRFTKTESDCEQLNRNQFALNRSLGSIEGKLNTLIIHLSATKKIDSNLFKSNSPIELTDVGVRILVEMGVKNYVDTHVGKLLEQMETQLFQSGLDVQNYCTVLLNERINDVELIPVKNYIFSNPMYKISETIFVPLDLTVAISIMAIYLRNRYFEKHPELRKGM